MESQDLIKVVGGNSLALDTLEEVSFLLVFFFNYAFASPPTP